MVNCTVKNNRNINFKISLQARNSTLFITIIFVLMSVYHACMGWTNSYEKLSSISVFSYVLVDFSFFRSLLIFFDRDFSRILPRFYARTVLCFAFLLICTCLAFKLAIHFRFTANTITSIMQPVF